MAKEYPSRREDWFVPHETTLKLPDGREITVDGIPYEGWGTNPGVWGIVENYEYTKEGGLTFDFVHRWVIPSS